MGGTSQALKKSQGVNLRKFFLQNPNSRSQRRQLHTGTQLKTEVWGNQRNPGGSPLRGRTKMTNCQNKRETTKKRSGGKAQRST